MRAGGRAPTTALAVLLCAALVGACTDDGDDDPPQRADSTVAPGELVEGGTVRLGVGGPVVVDPVDASLGSPTDLLVLDLLHDGLTRLDADGAPVSALAAEWRSNDARTAWRFTLDPEATFASGQAVTPADVIASLERIAKAGDTSLAALRLESITGFRDLVAGTAEHLAGLSAPDATTVRIALDTPLSVLPTILAAPAYGVVDVASLQDATGDDGSLADLDLSGAWAAVDAEDGGLRVERRDDAAGHLDAVELRSYDDATEAYDAFDDGDVDWAVIPSDRYGEALDEHGDAQLTPFHAELFFGMRVTGPALGNPELRKAIVAAIDREAIVDAVYADVADPLATVVPAGLPGHEAARCAECDHDPDRAQQLLAAAFPDGQIPTVHIDFDESRAQEAMARLVADQLESVGITATLRPQPLEEYKRFVVGGGQELFSFGWIGGYGSPDAYLAPLFGSAASDNLTGYASADVDRALAAARATSDAAVAVDLWRRAEARVLADAVVVPILQFRTQPVLAGRVQAFGHAVDGTVDWSAVWVTDGD